MLRASLLRLPSVITFFAAAALGMSLALLSSYYYLVSDVNSIRSPLSYFSFHKYNTSRNIALQMWHSHHMQDSKAVFLKKRIRVLCVIAVEDESEQDTLTAVQTVIDTWGKRCSQMIMFGSVPDIKFTSIPFHVVKTTYGDTWKAFNQVLSQVSTLFDMKFDWFLKVDVKTYVVMENLHYFVSSLDPSLPFYFGHTLSGRWGVLYNSANAGILMSRDAVVQLQIALTKGVCVEDESSGRSSDKELGRCLAAISIYPRDTRDAYGHARFLPFNLNTHLLQKSSWFSFLETKPKYPIKEGPECCSDYAVTFHNIPSDMMTVMEFFIYHVGHPNKRPKPSLPVSPQV